MHRLIKIVLTILGAAAGGWLAARFLSRLYRWPCPYWLSGILENPLVEAAAGAEKLLDILDLRPGMAFLDVGCGPGRVSLPAARRVGVDGQVTALDLQPEMLEMLSARSEEQGLANIRLVHGAAGTGLLGERQFDRAVLVTVLGETADRQAVLDEIYQALKPGGRLAVAELLPDPHFQSAATVHNLAERSGFREAAFIGRPWSFTIVLEK